LPFDTTLSPATEGRAVLPLEELGWMLAHIPPDCPYPEWVSVGMVIHGMHGAEGFKLWDTWSAQDASKYPGQFEMRKKWASFDGSATSKVGFTRLRNIMAQYQPESTPRPKVTTGPDRDPDYIRTMKAGVQIILPTVRNMAEFFAWDPKWKGRIRMNWRTWVEIDGATMRNSDWVDMAGVIAREWGCKEPRKSDVFEALEKAAECHSYEPMQEYLAGLTWDGIPRLDTWLVTAGAEDTPATRLIGRRWMIGAAGRGLHEAQNGAKLEDGKGTKMDYCLVLEGPQGVRKSSLLAALALPGLFFDSNFSFGKAGKAADLYMAMRRNFIVEMAELAGMTKSDVDDVKATLSSREDTYRPPYGRVVESFPRRSVLTGSVNEMGWVRDFTGARRFWPVPCSNMLDPDWVAKHRDQLWAEATHFYRAGEIYWEDAALTALLQPLHDERVDLPGWASRIEDFVISAAVQERKFFRMNTLITTYPNELMRQSQRTIGGVLRKLGWEVRIFRIGDKTLRLWVDKKAEVSPADVRDSAEVIDFEEFKAGKKEEK
jgi:predicted P-loop ATPase